MKALDPSGGYIDAHFPTGEGIQLWAKICNRCGEYVGGCYSGPGLPAPSVSVYAVCPKCLGKDIRLEIDR